MEQLSPTACIRFGWETFKKRPWFFVGAALILGVFSFSFEYEAKSKEELVQLLPLLPYILAAGLAWAAIRMAIEVLFTRFLLKAHDAVETMVYMEVLPARPFWKYVGGKLAVGIVVAIGFVLFIIPGIIASIALLFTPFLIVERKLWPLEAMKESARITRGNRWNVFFLWLLVIGLNILGFFAFIVGLLVTFPVSMLAITHAYRTLERATQFQTV